MEDISAERERLLAIKAALEQVKMDVTEVDRRIKALDREAAGPQQKLPHNRFDECRRALKKADAHVQALEEKRASCQERLGELQADLDAASRGLAKT